MNGIIERLNSGALHKAARQARPDSVDRLGNVHRFPARARFLDWLRNAIRDHGPDTDQWPEEMRIKLAQKHVRR